MKKILISTAVGGLLAWLVGALSWMALGVHTNTLKYNENQTEIRAFLDANLSESGVYGIPGANPEKPEQDHDTVIEEMEGKSWAMVHYIKDWKNQMGRQLVIGLLLNLGCAALITMIFYFTRMCQPSFWIRFAMAFAFFAFVLLNNNFMVWNFWNYPGHYISGEIIDTLLAGVVCSSWYAWFLGWNRVPW